MSYICRMKDKLGKLNLELCVEKNVPPGPLLGKLKAGEDITLADGTLVRAVDVKDPDETGAVFIGKLAVHFPFPKFCIHLWCHRIHEFQLSIARPKIS